MLREARIMLAGLPPWPSAVRASFSCERSFYHSPTRRLSRTVPNLNS